MNLKNIQLNTQKKTLIVIFFILIAYVDSAYILKAQRGGLKSLDQRVARSKKELADLNSGLENMRAFKNKSGLAQKVPKSSRILSEKQVSELLEEISNTANKFNIKISQIWPSRQAQKGKTAPGQGNLTSQLINLDLVSDYHNLGRFIQALEDSPVFMGVQDLEINAQLPDYMKQKVSLVLKTYVTK